MNSCFAFHDKAVYPDSSIVEMTIRELSGSVSGSRHMLKYSLFYGSPVTRIVGYDNERGKGDHKHICEVEEVDLFTTVEQLVADFLSDFARKRSKA